MNPAGAEISAHSHTRDRKAADATALAGARLRSVAAWVGCLAAAGLVCHAQSTPQEPPTQPAATQDAGVGEESAPRWDARGPRRMGPGGGIGRRIADNLAQKLFRIEPRDEGPLQPGEEEELMEFARERMPRFYVALDRLRERRPERFRERLAEVAPRLRHLQRVFKFSPQVGQILKDYAENMMEIERRARARGPDRADEIAALRELVAENVGLESAALDALAEELTKRSEQRIEERLASLLAPDADLSDEPERVREACEAYRAARSDAVRDELRARIRMRVARETLAEVDALRERAATMRARADAEIERRMDRFRERPGGRGMGPGGRGRPAEGE